MTQSPAPDLELLRRQLDYANRSLEELNYPVEPSDNILVQAILASWSDGILILTEQGKLIQANEIARRICDRISPGSQFSGQVPKDIWRVCQILISSRSQYPKVPTSVESDLRMNESVRLRIRVRWFKFDPGSSPYLLVLLEDQSQFAQRLAISEVDLYGLTPREAEVWLLYRTNYTYKEIAAELYLSIHTVKKHMRNIRTKRRMSLVREWSASSGVKIAVVFVQFSY